MRDTPSTAWRRAQAQGAFGHAALAVCATLASRPVRVCLVWKPCTSDGCAGRLGAGRSRHPHGAAVVSLADAARLFCSHSSSSYPAHAPAHPRTPPFSQNTVSRVFRQQQCAAQ
eukprot:Rhum_TRINITY_DN4857_c0_g2::Rhum_TRINITY_DN4857_c0_g2_i1::g.15894::m.15894